MTKTTKTPATTCDAFVSGSPYSRNGANRYDFCTSPAKYRVDYTLSDGTTGTDYVCGVHIRKWRGYEREIARGEARREKFPSLKALPNAWKRWFTVTPISKDSHGSGNA